MSAYCAFTLTFTVLVFLLVSLNRISSCSAATGHHLIMCASCKIFLTRMHFRIPTQKHEKMQESNSGYVLCFTLCMQLKAMRRTATVCATDGYAKNCFATVILSANVKHVTLNEGALTQRNPRWQGYIEMLCKL